MECRCFVFVLSQHVVHDHGAVIMLHGFGNLQQLTSDANLHPVVARLIAFGSSFTCQVVPKLIKCPFLNGICLP